MSTEGRSQARRTECSGYLSAWPIHHCMNGSVSRGCMKISRVIHCRRFTYAGRELQAKALKEWDQCGGKAGTGQAAGPWAGYSCPTGIKCVCDNDYYCNCRPNQQSNGQANSNGQAPAGGMSNYKPGPNVKAVLNSNGELVFSLLKEVTICCSSRDCRDIYLNTGK
jgi:hypothetical protein